MYLLYLSSYQLHLESYDAYDGIGTNKVYQKDIHKDKIYINKIHLGNNTSQYGSV